MMMIMMEDGVHTQRRKEEEEERATIYTVASLWTSREEHNIHNSIII